MPDLTILLHNHGYSEDDMLYVSWLDGVYYVDDPDTNSFKLTDGTDGANVQYDTTITEGYVRLLEDDSPVTVIEGLAHLEGEYVYVMSGGSIVYSGIVSGGSVTVPTALYSYIAGKIYGAKLKAMKFAIPGGDSTQTKIKRISQTIVRCIKTAGVQAGQEIDGVEYLTDLNTEFSNLPSDNAVLTKGGFSPDGCTLIKSTEPYPMTVLGVVIEVELWEK